MRKLILTAIVDDKHEIEIRLKLWETIINCKTKRWALASQEVPKEEQICKAIE